MVAGTRIELRGKVVTAIDTFGDRKGNFYIAEPGGGAFSGVLVFGAPLEQVALLAVGDTVDITGAEKDEFDGTGILTTPLPLPITEVVEVSGGQMTVTKVGTGQVPAPEVIDALAIGQMAQTAREAELEKWEGVLVTIENVRVDVGIRQISGAMPDPTFREFNVTGPLHIDSTLAAIPAAADGGADLVAVGDCLASVTGMGDYFYSHKVLPRATADIVAGGTGCPAPENTMLQCGDGIDNDANGFTDCVDNGCAGIATCMTTTTVAMIQSGAIATGAIAQLNDVYVIAIAPNGRHIWVADSLTAAPGTGIDVFRTNAPPPLPVGVVVGAQVDVSGRVDEFNSGGGTGTLTELGGVVSITFVAAPTGLPTPITGVSIATLANDTTGEPYEGSLVEITNVRVVDMLPVSFGVRKFGIQGATPAEDVVQFESDDDIRPQLTDAEATCYSLIRGIWSYQVFDDRWAILPLGGVGDVVTGSTCTP
jgi:hypothetical protein